MAVWNKKITRQTFYLSAKNVEKVDISLLSSCEVRKETEQNKHGVSHFMESRRHRRSFFFVLIWTIYKNKTKNKTKYVSLKLTKC